MRQPKFRGFSLETNNWHYGHGWFEVDYTDEYLREKGIKQQAMLYTNGYPVECELASMGEFTGLVDSEGTEIYEGDILECHYKIKGNVFFNDGSYGISSEECELNIKDINTYDNLNADLINDNNLVVIGNIYENPELLEESK